MLGSIRACGPVSMLSGKAIAKPWMFVSDALTHSQSRIYCSFKVGGPTYSVDTACPSCLEGINRASNSIRNAECDTALARGMNIATGSDNL